MSSLTELNSKEQMKGPQRYLLTDTFISFNHVHVFSVNYSNSSTPYKK